MIETIKKIIQRIKEGMLKDIWRETLWIYQYARRYWKSMVIYTLFGMTGTLLSLSTSMVSKNLIDIITGHQTGELAKTFLMMIGLAIGNILVSQVSSYASNWISLKLDTEIKADIFSKMLETDLESIASYHTGDLLTRWSSDASTISNGVLNWIPNLIIYTFHFIAAFAIVVSYDWTFAVFALLGIPVSALMSRRLMRRMRNNNKRSAAMNAKMSSFNQESFSNIQTLKAFNLIHLYVNRLKNLQSEYISMRMEFQRMSIATSILMSIVGLAVSYSCYGWGIYRVWSGVISYGTMTMFLSLSSSLTSTLNALISLVPTAISLTTSAGRLMDILEMPREDYSLDEETQAFYDAHRSEGVSIIMEDISYSYHNGTSVFQKASFAAHPHEIVALVGPSGQGKTTMMRLLLALLRPQEGNAYLMAGAGGKNAARLLLTPSSRELFSYVPQGNTMFSGTIAENMRNVKEDATDEEIIHALTLSCAWEFVQKLPDGIYSVLLERGGGLSEGQAQRLSIARALLRQSPILLLDEATSALDVATERRVLKSIMADTYPRTCIVTTHRPTVLSMCQRVYRIQNEECVILEDEEIDRMIHDF
jgi:ABC-type bacteriocin/lantibiotic exporter with double-glycine peptidase domain